MPKINTLKWDPAKRLATEKNMAAYLEEEQSVQCASLITSDDF